MADKFLDGPEAPKTSDLGAHTRVPDYKLMEQQLDAMNARYENEFRFKPGDPSDPFKCKTIHEMVECLDKNPMVQLDARVIHQSRSTGKREVRRMKREAFVGQFKANEKRFLENFDTGGSVSGSGNEGYGGPNSGLVGDDYVPLLGGPFNKQLYLYDMLDQTQQAYWAYNHDPFARRIIHTILDFCLGKGYRVDFKDPHHGAIWDAFYKVNDMYTQSQYFCKEVSMYGESMWWWLPNNEVEINIQRDPSKFKIRRGIIPRIRVMDPSQFWDFITHPEDINSVIAYQWVTPTQWQLYTGVTTDGKNGQPGQSVPISKFIYQQIPAEDIIHAKLNNVSNEKRGRSDLFPVLGYLKRLRDTVNYSIIGMQKSAAWSLDTTIEGNMDDLTNYIASQQNLGTIPPAASEFVHTSKIKREYLSNSATSHGGEPSAFIWCLNMIAAASGIPISYFGSHLSGGQTRASAVVGTEPVAKLFENRQQFIENTIRKIIDGLMMKNGISDYEATFTWPEVITQDRSQKLKDILLAEQAKWFSPKRAGTMASKEFEQTEYVWENEIADINSEQAEAIPTAPGPLSSPPTLPGAPTGGKPATSGLQPSKPVQKPSAMTSGEKKTIRNDYSS